MNRFLSALPNGFRQIFSIIVSLICCYLFLWILTWMLYWTAKYGFLPTP